jgi:hypothetical protein
VIIHFSNIELSGSHDMLHESFIAIQWLKSVMKYKDKTRFGYVITVDADTEGAYPAVFLRSETTETERFTSNRHVIEERLRLWLTEG